MRFACVLRSGGDFEPKHVTALVDGITQNYQNAEIICLSDIEVSDPRVNIIPLAHGWPGWWSKMELFRPEIEGDILYMDLDTTIVGDLHEIASVDRLTVLTDFYWHRTRKIQSSMMFIPERCRRRIWDAWKSNPAKHMRECVTRDKWGDQGFLQRYWEDAQRWQEVLPKQVVSYKCHVRESRSAREYGNGVVPGDARVICFHGRPRPWDSEVKLKR